MNVRILSVVVIPILCSSISLAQPPQIIFEATFDSTLLTAENESPTLANGLSFANGITGPGIVVETGDILQYPVQNNINSERGSLSVWVRPDWDPGDVLYRIFVLGNDPRNFELHLDENKQLAFSVNTSQIEGKPIKVAFGSADNWKAGAWYYLTCTWSPDAIKIYVNGEIAGESTTGFDIPLVTEGSFHLGSLDGEQAFKGVMDDLRIFDGPLAADDVQGFYQDFLDQLPLADAVAVTDLFGRDITESGMTLVDWEGPIRNPALKYFLQGDESLEYPLELLLSSNVEQAYFNLPSTISKSGPTKSITVVSGESLVPILFSVFMDEDGDNETFDLTLRYPKNGVLSRQTIPVMVIDQDYDRALTYPVIVDFSEAIDPFMLDPAIQEIIVGAAEDWLYYVDGTGIDSIEAGGSSLMIGGQDHSFTEKTVSNPQAYKGYYLYAYENTNDQGPCFCSTGFPNRQLLQTNNGESVPVPRIGGLHLNMFGQDFGEVRPDGWEISSPYENWTLEGFTKTDLYTIAKHEIGHAMVFEELPLFKEAQERLGFVSPAITEYYGASIVPLFPESLAHLYGILDPASQITPYGGGVEDPVMPIGREMLTKLDVLIMESVGYPLRENEVTRSLSLNLGSPINGVINQVFSTHLIARGGVPVYHFEVMAGELPEGLALNAFTGEIFGTPVSPGTNEITFLVRDYDAGGAGVYLNTVIDIYNEGSFEAELLSFNITGQLGETLINDSTRSIVIVMPQGTDLTTLSPVIEVSNGASISPGNGVPLNFTESVSYTVTSENGAVNHSWTATVLIEGSTGLDDQLLTHLTLYPNPFANRLNIELQLLEPENTSIYIYNSNGILLRKINAGTIQFWNQSIDLSELNPGLFLLQIVTGGEIRVNYRLVKE